MGRGQNRLKNPLDSAPTGPIVVRMGEIGDPEDREAEERRKTHRGVEEIDIETGRSLGSPIEEGAGARPKEEDEEGDAEG